MMKTSGVANLASEKHYGLALTLGGGEVTMEELARMYAMLANRGIVLYGISNGVLPAQKFSKYGMTVADNPLELRQWAVHAYEEALDLAIYLKRVIDVMDQEKTP